MEAMPFSEGVCRGVGETLSSVVLGDMWAIATLLLLKLIVKLHCISIKKS